MTSIDDRLHEAAVSLHDSLSGYPGPGPSGIERKSRRRKHRRAGAGVAAAFCAVGFAWMARPPETTSLQVASRVPESVSVKEIESCRANFEQMNARGVDMAMFGLDLNSIDAAQLDIVVGFRSASSDHGLVALQGQGILMTCLTTTSGRVDSFGLSAADGTLEPAPAEVWVHNYGGGGASPDAGPRFDVVGQSGSLVTAVDAVLADGTVVPGHVSAGWFAIEGPAVSDDSMDEFELVWSLADGSTRVESPTAILAPRDPVPITADQVAIDLCSASLDDAVASTERVRTEGDTNAGGEEEAWRVTTFESSTGAYTQVVFERADVVSACVTDDVQVLSSDFVWFDTIETPGVDDLIVYSTRTGVQDEATAPSGPVFLLGKVGGNVDAVEVLLDDGSVIEGVIEDGWFAVSVEGSPTAIPIIIEIRWTLGNGDTRSAPVSDVSGAG